MADEGSIIQGDEREDSSSIEDIFADAVADMDATASDDDGTTGDGAPDSGAASDQAADGSASAASDEGGDQQEAEPADFLAASGVTLEQMLEGVDDPNQRAFLESRYKDMQRHFTRRTQELSKQAEKPAETDEAAQLRLRIAELEARSAPTPQAAPLPSPDEAVKAFIYKGIDHVITEEEAVETPAKLGLYVKQQSLIAAREAQIPIMRANYERVSRIEAQQYQQALKESQTVVDNLFRDVPQYRTPEVESRIAEVFQANPALTLEDAFNVVLGPQLRTDSFRVGQRAGEVVARRTVEPGLKERMSVPAAGSVGETGPALPGRGASFDEVAAYAVESVNEAR